MLRAIVAVHCPPSLGTASAHSQPMLVQYTAHTWSTLGRVLVYCQMFRPIYCRHPPICHPSLSCNLTDASTWSSIGCHINWVAANTWSICWLMHCPTFDWHIDWGFLYLCGGWGGVGWGEGWFSGTMNQVDSFTTNLFRSEALLCSCAPENYRVTLINNPATVVVIKWSDQSSCTVQLLYYSFLDIAVSELKTVTNILALRATTVKLPWQLLNCD